MALLAGGVAASLVLADRVLSPSPVAPDRDPPPDAAVPPEPPPPAPGEAEAGIPDAPPPPVPGFAVRQEGPGGTAAEEGPTTAAATIQVRHGESGAPVAARVRLWRLGLPETETLTAGDEPVDSHSVPEEGLRIGGLEPGKYRLECPGQRKGAEDPPAFRLRRGENEVAVEILPPRSFRVRLAVFTEGGGPLERGVREHVINSSYSSRSERPSWAEGRWKKNPDGTSAVEVGFGSGVG